MSKTSDRHPENIRTFGAALEGAAKLHTPPEPGGWHRLRIKDRGDGWKVFGFVSDTHLGSKHYRPDVLKALYAWFASEHVSDVFHGGNWIEGQSRINQHDISVFGLDAQLAYFIEHYPRHDGITTHYIAGDDHEGWYQQREVFSVGEALQNKARAMGRNDLHYLGYVEADVELVGSKGSSVLRVMHGGGGSAYAVSYRPQKIVESWTGGEKASVLLLGHYHKLSYNLTRNVHVVQGGCVCDQSIFMRKKSIEAHVGGCLIKLRQGKDGAITEFVPHFRTFFDRSFYARHYD
jgi:predicted phosphodiesterase